MRMMLLFQRNLLGRFFRQGKNKSRSAPDGRVGCLCPYHLNHLTGGRRQPKVVITDIVMPEKEGIETIMELRKSCPSVKIVAISGGVRTGTNDFLHLAKKLGADEILSKPLDMDRLENLMKSYCSLGI
jgi:CheY-like chemotaxis protein